MPSRDPNRDATTKPCVAGHCPRGGGLASGGSCGFVEQSCCASAARGSAWSAVYPGAVGTTFSSLTAVPVSSSSDRRPARTFRQQCAAIKIRGGCQLASASVDPAKPPLPGATTAPRGELAGQLVTVPIAGRGQAIRDGGEPAVVDVHRVNQRAAGPAVAGLGVGVGGAAVGLLVGPLDAPEGQQALAVPVGALAVEAFGMPNGPADPDLQRPGTGDPDLPELAADQSEQVVGVVGGAPGGGDEPLVAAVAVGVDGPAGGQPIGADPVRAVGQRQVGNAAAGQQDADVPLAGLPGRIKLGVGQQLVAGLVAIEVTGDA